MARETVESVTGDAMTTDMLTTEVLMPLMGEGITEATLVKWLKRPGDAVLKAEPLLEVSTDKVDTEIPSPAAGVLVETYAKDGETVAINTLIGLVAASGTAAGRTQTASPAQPRSSASAAPARAGNQAPAATLRAAVHADSGRVPSAAPGPMALGVIQRSSPLVRKIARAENIDLALVQGSGLNGRITKRDLEAFAGDGAAKPVLKAGPAGAGKDASHLEHGRLETKVVDGREELGGVPVRREKLSKMRSLIADHMVRSVRTSPHVTTVFEIDLHRVVRAREREKAAFAQREGFNLTYTPFFLHAAVAAIKRHPVVNVSVDGDDILWKDQINLGVAVAIESGLIVPVIRDAGELNLLGIARRLNDLALRARTKKLVQADVQGGTFSVTNPGMFGSLVSAPIINQPQVAILAIGAVIKRPVVVDDMIAIRPLVQIGLTFDHRVVDGEGGARYLATLKELLEGFDGEI